MNSPTETPELSIVIEWENVLLAEAERAVQMLKRLEQQLYESGRSAEVLILFDQEEVQRSIIEQAMDQAGVGEAFRALAQLVPVKGLSYYDLKNEGARMTRGKTLLFIDSDIIPDENWLESLLEVADRQDVQVVGSTAYIDGQSLYAKTFALAWFFPLPDRNGPAYPAKGFFANSVAFQRETFLKHPFPPADGKARGRCTTLSHILADNGVTIWRHPAACVGHPPPNGFKHFVSRALYEGHDFYLTIYEDETDKRKETRWPGLKYYYSRMRRSFRMIRRNREKVNLSLPAVPVAVAIAWTYWTLVGLGYFVTRLKPDFIPRRLSLG